MFDRTELEELATKIAGADERLVADDDLMADVRTLERVRSLIETAVGSRVAELDARGTTDVVTGHRTAGWLAKECGVSPGTARARVQLGRVLRCDLRETDRAVREGRLCTDRARVMAAAVNERIAAEFAEMEASLIGESARMTFAEWAQRVRLVAALLDQDGPEPADDVANNRLRLKGSGADVSVGGRLVGDVAVTSRAAIEQMADELWRQYRDDHQASGGAVEVPSRETLRALAFAELCRRGLMVGTDGTATRPRVEATLVINTDTPDVVHVNGEPLVTGSASALACDMSVWTIVLNSLGVPLDMGREIRTANREQRRALEQRDGGCVFPGCGMRPDQCDAHHVAQWYRDLGTTDVKHMVFLCRHHHGVIHRRGWDLRIGDDGWSWIVTPDHDTTWCQRHGETRSGAPPG